MQKGLWSKHLLSWYLYDFANSLMMISIGLYFSQWVVVDQGFPDFYFALAYMIPSALLIFISPYLGEVADAHHSHYRIFVTMSILGMLASVMLWYTGTLNLVWAAIFFYGAYQFCVQLALVPYGAFIKSLAHPKQYGAASGIGYASGQFGSIIGLLITLPIIGGSILFFGTGRLAAILPGIFAFFLFSLPSFIYLPRAKFRRKKPQYTFFSSVWKALKESRKHKGVLGLLVAFYFFSDAMASITLFAAIYLQKVLAVPDNLKVLMYVLVIVGVLVGSFIGGFISDRFGHRRTTILGLLFTIIAILGAAFATTMTHIFISFPAFGLFSGAVYASSRAYLASLIPAKESGKYFGLYALSERFGSILGPGIWSLVVWLLPFPWNYRMAVVSMAVLVAIGIIPLLMRQKDMGAIARR
jgi:MFS transporter, UMF1 family